jgi:hypothetical protein
MKKLIYLVLFIVLGILLSFLFHAAIEIPFLLIFFDSGAKSVIGLTWSQWLTSHAIGSGFLLVAGIIFGYWQGGHWWKVIYVQKKKPQLKQKRKKVE